MALPGWSCTGCGVLLWVLLLRLWDALLLLGCVLHAGVLEVGTVSSHCSAGHILEWCGQIGGGGMMLGGEW